jgi:hypothetical protein
MPFAPQAQDWCSTLNLTGDGSAIDGSSMSETDDSVLSR